ncbi:MAG: ATP-binding protein, partial [Actinomycetota bacterium]|nr:ATP-binding protein [Actinomycetota bacterium]
MAEPATGRAQAPGAVDRENPFQGLEYYSEADAEWFFGRTTDRKVIIAHLRTARLTVLYAESGVGKSSLLRAGVAARLREVATRSIEERGYPKFLPVVFKGWKDDPVRDLIATIRAQTRPFAERMRELGISPPQLGAGRWEPPLDAERFTATDGDRFAQPLPDNELASSIEETTGALGGTLVIMLDQFEEHFGYRVGQEHPERLADQLARCINARDIPANFLIAVREDSYGKIGDLFRGRIGNVYRNYLRLDYLRRESARDAIEGPVRVYNSLHEGQRVQIGPGLIDAVLDEVRRGNLTLAAGTEERGSSEASKDEIETPFLQLIMKRLWEYELGNGSQVLRKETLDDDLGGAQSIVNSHFSRALRDLSPQEVEMAGAIFADLVTPSGAKIAHTTSDLADRTAQSEDAVRAVLEKLDAERIVRAVESAPGSRESRYEIFHDRLAAPILEWRKQQEKARLEREKRHAEEEAQQERNQARRFRRLATVVGVLAAGCIIA